MQTVLVFTKSPSKKGRIGLKEWQDWYRMLKSIQEHQVGNRNCVLIPSDVQLLGEDHEIKSYRRACKDLLIKNLHCLRKGFETTSQLDAGVEFLKDKTQIIIACGALHFPRVWYLVWRAKIPVKKYLIGWGLPRLMDFFWDPFLLIIFPLIEIFGLKEYFIRKTKERRNRGVI